MDIKQILSVLAGGITPAGSYVVGVLSQVPPTGSIPDAIGGVGWVIAGVLFIAGALGVNVALKAQPPGGAK